MTVRRLLFDCDGVLVDSEAVALGVLLARFGEVLGPGVDIGARLKDLLGLPIEEIAERIGRDHGCTFEAEWIGECRHRIEQSLLELADPITDVAWALERLDMPMAVVSNSGLAHVRGALERTGLARFFDAVFTAEQVGRSKPAPDLYRFAAASLGVEPEHCLAVEDSRAGVTAAVAAGMTVIGFTGGGHLPEGHAHVQHNLGVAESVATMRELPAAVERLLARSPSGSEPHQIRSQE
jgi:HAD superfamily hydrolase (TIGR01509 family)